MDVCKVFVAVSHRILLRKTRCSWLGWKYSSLGESWLNGQVQKVAVNETKSSWWKVTSGIPSAQDWADPI